MTLHNDRLAGTNSTHLTEEKQGGRRAGTSHPKRPILGLTPPASRAVCFFDLQNLHLSAEEAFGIKQDIDPVALARHVCAQRGWRCDGIRVYSGAPDPRRELAESRMWNDKRMRMEADSAFVYDRLMQYRDHARNTAEGSALIGMKGKEKGIDLRIGLDIAELAYRNEIDVALLFSRDQDFSELIQTVDRLIGNGGREVRLISAFPTSRRRPLRGIYGMQWIELERAAYKSCLEQRTLMQSEMIGAEVAA